MTKKQRYEYNKQWLLFNPGKKKEYYENRKKAGLTDYDPEYYAENKEMFRDTQYRSNEKHKEKRKAYLQEYYQKNKEYMKVQQKQYNDQKRIEEAEKKLQESSETMENFYKSELRILKDGLEVFNLETKKFEKK